VTAVEIKDVELPVTMQRAMAKQAEAEREKRAKIIHAQGELQASTQLAQAAQIIGSQPSALQLRYLQTLTEIAVEKNSTIVFPLPIDLIEPFIDIMRRSKSAASQDGPAYTLPVPQLDQPQAVPYLGQPSLSQQQPVAPTAAVRAVPDL